MESIQTSQLQIAYLDEGPADGWPCILNHGFPFDVHAYDDCIAPLTDSGARVIVPYLRGYGPTRFTDENTLRSGEQAALANDLKELMDALKIEKAVLAGYDWGGRASCIVAALWPERVNALVSGNSYNIQNIANSHQPAAAEQEASYWYQYYFHTERGRLGLEQNRQNITKLLWKMWSPPWDFSDSCFEKTATSFENPDFVEVVIHSYRHRYGLAEGDPAVAHIEEKLKAQPDIVVPSITVDGANDTNAVGGTEHHGKKFTGPHQHRVFPNTGHNMPQEQPELWCRAILDARNLG